MAIKLDKKFDKNNVVRNLARQFKLVPHLERALQEFDEEWTFEYETKQGDDAWHPSGDCIPTVTELWEKAKGLSDKPNFNKKNGMVGHFWHQYLQWVVLHKLEFCTPEAIERKGIKGWGEMKPHSHRKVDPMWKPYHWATGAGDIAPCSIPVHGDYVVDFKTMGSHDFNKNGVPNWCAEKYEAQINIYMDFFDVEKAIIVAIQKDTPHNMKEFEYVRDQELIDTIYAKWEFVAELLDSGHEPEPEDDDLFPLEFAGPVE